MTSILDDLLALSTGEAPTAAAAEQREDAASIGPARVLSVEGPRVRVLLRGRPVAALLALGYRYEPVPGDLLLVAAQGENAYVIGVLAGKGRVLIDAPGDLALRAPRGEITLLAGRGVRVKAPRIALVAEKLESVARTATETFGNLRQRIAEDLDVQAENVRTRARTLFRLRGGKIVQRADEEIKIDGRQVHLG